MPSIKGKVVFRRISNQFNDIGLAGIVVYLQNLQTNKGIAVLSDMIGGYRFNNVPSGDYLVVQSNEMLLGIPVGEVDFSLAITRPLPKAGVLDITRVPEAIRVGSRLTALNRTTIPIKVENTDVEVFEKFINTPVIDIPMDKGNSMRKGSNIWSFGDFGQFGELPPGIAIEESPSQNPYPDLVDNIFFYDKFRPATIMQGDILIGDYYPKENSYAITNTLRLNFNRLEPRPEYIWHSIADHTIGDERGRMLLVGNNSTSRTLIKKTVDVKMNTDYMFSFWAANTVQQGNTQQPKLRVIVSTVGGQVISSSNNTELVQGDILNWVEVGTMLNSGSNTRLNFEIFVEYNMGNFNLYAVDDISIYEIEKATMPTFIKSLNKSLIFLGDILTYTLVLNNTTGKDLLNVKFTDTVPAELFLESKSIEFSGDILTTTPAITAFKPVVKVGEALCLSYMVRVLCKADISRVLTSSGYVEYTTMDSTGAQVVNKMESNKVTTTINSPKLEIVKMVNKTSAKVGEKLIYTIEVKNAGNAVLENVNMGECVTKGIGYIPKSLKINNISVGCADELECIIFTKLVPGEKRTISYETRIMSLPQSMKIASVTRAKYEYYLEPHMLKQCRKIESNEVVTTIIRPGCTRCCNYC